MKIRTTRPNDLEKLIPLVAQFRVALAQLRRKTREPNTDAARAELAGYQSAKYPIFVAEGDDSALMGYLVCRVEENVVWAESLFVTPESRRRGIGSALYARAEQLARESGSKTVYNWVHPNNDRIIALLRKHGYDVLNLVELRKALPDEKPGGGIRVGQHEFRY